MSREDELMEKIWAMEDEANENRNNNRYHWVRHRLECCHGDGRSAIRVAPHLRQEIPGPLFYAGGPIVPPAFGGGVVVGCRAYRGAEIVQYRVEINGGNGVHITCRYE